MPQPTFLLEWPESTTLTTPKAGEEEERATGALAHWWWECRMVQPLCKTVWWFLRKPNICLPHNPATVHIGIYPKELKTCPGRNLHRNVNSSFMHNCQILDAIKMSLREWMDKLNLVHPDNGIFFSTKKNCAVKSGKDMEEP